MNKNQLKSFISKTINEQYRLGFNARSLINLFTKGKSDVFNWVKKNSIEQLPQHIQYEIINLIYKHYDDVPVGLQKIVDKYIK